MNAHPHHYELHAEDELTRILNEAKADRRPVVLTTPTDRFRVIRDTDTVNLTDDPAAHFDAAKVRAAVHASAGAMAGVDRDALLADLRAQRGQDSTGRPAD